MARSIWVKKLLLSCIAGLVGLLAGEIVLRAIGFTYPVFGQPDLDLGTSYVPGASGRWTEEGDAHVRINRFGLRGGEVSPERAAGTYRVAVLGDSFIAALAVAEDSTFVSVLQRRLEACAALSGRTVECLNFGIEGHGSAQQLVSLRTRVRPFRPDLVILAFFPGNDVRNNSKVLGNRKAIPYFDLVGDSLQFDDSYRQALRRSAAGARWQSFLKHATNHSRVLQITRRARDLLRHRIRARRRAGVPVAARDLGVDVAVYGPPDGEAWRQAWQLTDRIVLEIARESAHQGAEFLAFVIPEGPMVHPDDAERSRFLHRVEQALGEADLEYAEKRMLALGERAGFPVVPLLAPLLERAKRSGDVLYGFASTGNLGAGHWNEAGNRAAAEIVADRFCGPANP